MHQLFKILNFPNKNLYLYNQISNNGKAFYHIPVMKEELIQVIKPKNGHKYLDMTYGGGGHTEAILNAAPGATVYCLDRDPVAFDLAKQYSESCSQIVPIHGKFSQISELLPLINVKEKSLDGAFIDAGASSMQFDSSVRGFALAHDGPLDMRMNQNNSEQSVTAEDVVNCLDEEELRIILKKYGEEKKSRQIAYAIVDYRLAFGKISTTKQLADIVARVYNSTGSSTFYDDKLKRPAHVATKTFQALRIFVNDELNELYNALQIVHMFLKTGAVCAAISFHSLEDRIIKRSFHDIDIDIQNNMSITGHIRNSNKTYNIDEFQNITQTMWTPVFKKSLMPSDDEISINPRSRSAKLRAAYKN